MVAGYVWLAWALGVATVELEAVRRALVRARPFAPMDLSRMRALVVRPCAGTAPWLDAALGSVARSRRSFAMRTRLAIASSTDAAAPVVERASADLSAAGLDAAVVVTAAGGPNRKAAQLAAVVASEPDHDVIIVADGDVDLGGLDLDALVLPLAHGAAVAWAPPVEGGARVTSGDRASAAVLASSLHAFPILATLDRASFVGKLFAIRGDALARVGGFRALVAHLGEDIELARLLRAAGERVVVAPVVARSLATGRRRGDVTARLARWITVIRAQRPWLLASYPLLFGATLPILALAFVARDLPLAALAFGLACVLGARVAVGYVAATRAGSPRLARVVSDIVRSDVVLLAAFLKALASRRVVWCGVELTIDRAGRLREEPGA